MQKKGPKWKGRKRPSHDHIHARRRTWLSEGIPDNSNKRDIGPKLSSASWFDAPIYKLARMNKWNKIRQENVNA